MVQNYTSLNSPESGARSSRMAIKDELIGKLVFDDPRVFQRLALDRVSPEFVDKCAQALQMDQKLLDARRELQKITAAAAGKSPEELEEEEDVEDTISKRTIKKKVEEKKMYKPLTCVFQCVENLQDSSGTSPKHSFECTNSTILKSDSSTWGFLKSSPDFGMFECSARIASGKKHVLWRHSGGFCEIKPTAQQGPKPAKPQVVKELVCQAADYARLHLSARPFQLFSVGLLIFGSQFCVGIFDRAGVVFSPIHDMWEETGIFIRVIRSLTCYLSPVELGQDPTVTVLSDQQHEIWRSETRHLGREAPKDFPTFVVSVGGRRWYTVGVPIWISVSLLGRGTCVWLVQENGRGPLLVLKNAWRSGSRISESTINGSVDGHHPALAKLYQGEDVLFPEEQRYITTCNLRGPSLNDDIEGDVFLHRLLLESRGRPLWEYHSEKELLQGIRAALSAHEFLCKQGILHRDISAGNIMLTTQIPPEKGAEGFLMDLEFARLDHSYVKSHSTKNINVPPVRTAGGGMTALAVNTHTVFGMDAKRGAAMTGTAQFMALDILQAIVTKTPIEPEPKHDIESFIYVLAYSVTRRAVLDSGNLDKDTCDRLHSFFHSTFARMKLDDIANTREAPVPLRVRHRFPTLISAPMAELMHDLDEWLTQSRLSQKWNPRPLTHAYVLSVLDDAIAKMI